MKYAIHKNLHTDFSVFEQNKLPPRSYFIPFSNTENLMKTDYKNERYQSDRITMLSGEWDFVYYDRLSKITEGFDPDRIAFDKADIPCTWQRTGCDQIAYINTRYPFPKRPPHIPTDAAVGIYRKKVQLYGKGTRRILTFLGVAGALAVYMNGKYVGYSEGSHNTAEFDITAFATEGDNEIVCAVYKWSNGTYLECQDMFRENGIFRDVYIVRHAESYVNDFLFRTAKNSDGTYHLTIDIDAEFSPSTKISVTGTDKDGKELFSTQTKSSALKYLPVKQWSAETPNLYTVTISLSENGKEVEAVRTYIGFKDIKIDGEVFRFNSKAIKLKGVNHHDTHMTKGYAMSLADLELDVRLMKEYNVNCVRTSHYPPDPAFLTMCDLYGLYVIDEADIETHGFYAIPHSTYRPNRLSNDLKWAGHYLDRVKRMYERDKNHPAITMWSLGNESGGYKCQDVCYRFLKKANPEIPVHYEGVNRSKRWCYDVVSHMYAQPPLMRKVLAGNGGKKYTGKPFFQCEYAHAMGNGPGGLEEYMQLFYSSEQFMGGCIWEWADHSVYDENAAYKWTYGGDHNEPIHDGNFCVDGLFYPDRSPSSGALEMKAVYRPVRAKFLSKDKVEFWNTRSFADTEDIRIKWELSVNGIITESGVLSPVIHAGEKETIALDCIDRADKSQDIFVNLTYTERESGFEIAKEQLEISRKALQEEVTAPAAKISEGGGKITVSYDGGTAVFDKKKGLVSYKKDSAEFINPNPLDSQFGFVPHIYRGRLDNDQYMVIYWIFTGLGEAKAKLFSCGTVTTPEGKSVRTVYHMVTRGVFVLARATVDYRFDSDGTAHITACLKQVSPLPIVPPRFGVHAELPAEFENVSYYGRGETESYSDFREHTLVGIFKNTVTNMVHKYIKPQDSGNRSDVRRAEISDANGAKLSFSAVKKYMNFNANHFTLEQLKKAAHIEDLPDTATTYTAVDGFVRGTGSGSCGPIPSKEHLIQFNYLKPLKFSFTVSPKKE